MEHKDYFLDNVKRDLEDTFRLYYDLTFGFYDLNAYLDLKTKELSKKVHNEVYSENGKFYILFQKINKVEKQICNLESKAKENDKNFDINESMSNQIRELYEDAIREISKLMFIYGVGYGTNLKKYLDNVDDA